VRSSRDHVDGHGCTHLQMDADLDGWCNPDRPRDARNRWLETKDEWCVGIDNCKFVANPDQAITVRGATRTIGDACNTGEVFRCCRRVESGPGVQSRSLAVLSCSLA
jgi:hypothetical protein